MSDAKAAIEHLRMALKEMTETYPCLMQDSTCHCVTCIAKHALSATGGEFK